MRLSKTGEEIEELNSIAVLLIKTKVPSKYLLIDRETGELYQGQRPDKEHSWQKVGKLTKRELRQVELNRIGKNNGQP